ncbi:hypothetical protein [Haloplanus salinarum]|uniref:hypothetical protein n=1 Tax=Haloplanus salinarum TaxID=1912324 RepID=UPI003B430C43
MQEATPIEITEAVSMRVDEESKEYDVIRSAMKNGSATRTGQNKWFDRRNTVLLNQTVYTVNETRLGSEKATKYEVGIDFTPENTTSELGVIRYDKLPPIDRRQLNRTLSQGSTEKSPGELNVEYEPTGGGTNKSVFVPEQQYDILQYNGEQYRVTVEREFSSDVEYQYEVTEAAANVKEFAEQLRNKYLFTLDGLSPAEREVIEEAIETGEVAWESEDSESVISKIREHTALSQDGSSGTWLMKYDGNEYLVTLSW